MQIILKDDEYLFKKKLNNFIRLNNIENIDFKNHEYLVKFKNQKDDKPYRCNEKNILILKKVISKDFFLKKDIINKFTNNSYNEINNLYFEPINNIYFIYKNEHLDNIKNDKVNEFIKLYKLYKYYYEIAKIPDSSKLEGEESINSESDDNGTILSSEYKKINSLWYSDDTILYDVFSNKLKENNETTNLKDLILPFNHNETQVKAISTALKNKITIIEGPPGTGKTATIINLIANIIYNDKNLAIVSNNNSAVTNVCEKLSKYDFLFAKLGSNDNKVDFFKNLNSFPNFQEENKYCEGDLEKLNTLIKKENSYFKAVKEKTKLKNDYENFMMQYKKSKYYSEDNENNNSNIDKNKLINLILKLKKYKKSKLSFFKRLSMFIKYKISFENSKKGTSDFIDDLIKSLIEKSKKEYDDQLNKNESEIDYYKKNDYYNQILNISKNIFNNYLKSKFDKDLCLKSKDFTIDNYKYNFINFIKRFPIVTSSTYSLLFSIPADLKFKFDYLIIDEASLSTLTSTLPLLLICKNIVILGDVHQINPIITNNLETAEEKIFKDNLNLNDYRDKGKSLLEFMQNYLKKVNCTKNDIFLDEHYRCAKQIIDFSNKKIYKNRLIINENKSNDKDKCVDNVHLKLIVTSEGSHGKYNDDSNLAYGKGRYNQREIDEIVEEYKEISKTYKDEDIGIITPYRRQVNALKKTFSNKKIEIGTVHTFQGKERKVIFYSTVVNKLDNFVNDDNLFNVAITRAIDLFILVTNPNITRADKGIIPNFIQYFKYQENTETIENRIKSIFDPLYTMFDNYYINKKLPESESLLKEALEKILKEDDKYSIFTFHLHVTLKEVVNIDKEKYNEKEYKYLTHNNTHLDFVIYNIFSKKPVLAIEVNGVKYHEQNIKQIPKDEMKKKCVENAKLKFIPLATNGSNEEKKIKIELEKILKELDSYI